MAGLGRALGNIFSGVGRGIAIDREAQEQENILAAEEAERMRDEQFRRDQLSQQFEIARRGEETQRYGIDEAGRRADLQSSVAKALARDQAEKEAKKEARTALQRLRSQHEAEVRRLALIDPEQASEAARNFVTMTDKFRPLLQGEVDDEIFLFNETSREVPEHTRIEGEGIMERSVRTPEMSIPAAPRIVSAISSEREKADTENVESEINKLQSMDLTSFPDAARTISTAVLGNPFLRAKAKVIQNRMSSIIQQKVNSSLLSLDHEVMEAFLKAKTPEEGKLAADNIARLRSGQMMAFNKSLGGIFNDDDISSRIEQIAIGAINEASQAKAAGRSQDLMDEITKARAMSGVRVSERVAEEQELIARGLKLPPGTDRTPGQDRTPTDMREYPSNFTRTDKNIVSSLEKTIEEAADEMSQAGISTEDTAGLLNLIGSGQFSVNDDGVLIDASGQPANITLSNDQFFNPDPADPNKQMPSAIAMSVLTRVAPLMLNERHGMFAFGNVVSRLNEQSNRVRSIPRPNR